MGSADTKYKSLYICEYHVTPGRRSSYTERMQTYRSKDDDVGLEEERGEEKETRRRCHMQSTFFLSFFLFFFSLADHELPHKEKTQWLNGTLEKTARNKQSSVNSN